MGFEMEIEIGMVGECDESVSEIEHVGVVM